MKTVLELVKTTLEASTTIKTWCQTKFGRAPMIFIGIDPFNPPPFSNCPMIAISTGTRYRETNQQYRSHSMHVGVAIHTDTQIRAGNVVKFLGIDLIDEFSAMVEAVVTKAMNQAGYASNQEPGFEDVITPPYFEAVWTYSQIRVKNLL